jgi:aryl-alcohol dehydrogenase-like predicted oxidoreductase
MEYGELGRTGLKVSRICLGTMTWGFQNTEAEGHAQMDYALDRGVNFFDTAEMYAVPTCRETHGRTEEIIGTWFRKTGNRDRVILASKLVGPSESRFDYVRDGKPRLDRKNIHQAVDDSLKRLQTDYIDLYQTHWPDRTANNFGTLGWRHDPDADELPLEETLGALNEMVTAGKIRHIGVSNDTPWGVMKMVHLAETAGLPRIVSIQNPYNLLNRSFEVGLAEIAMREHVGLLAYAPIAAGFLSGKYLGGKVPPGSRADVFKQKSRYDKPGGHEATRRYVEIAERHGLDPVQMAHAFVNSRPFLTANIVGASKPEQLRTAIDSLDVTLSEAVLTEIEAVHAEISNPCP